MSEQITWGLNVEIAQGPKFSTSQALEVEAYDNIDVTVPSGDSTTPGKATVDAQPGAPGQVKFLLITASVFDPKLSYTVDGGPSHPLDAPLLLVGNGAVKMIGPGQKQFLFSNETGKAVSVKILVGRTAIQPTPPGP